MKKNRTTKVAIILLALVLATTCFVGSTFAKYITAAEGEDSARVAKWGVTIVAESDVFAIEYAEDVTPNTGTLSVKSDVDVVAPGTTGTATLFTIAGVPEVDVQLDVSLGAIKMVTLPAADATYLNYNTPAVDDTYDLAEDYKPVKWTLTKDGAAITNDSSVQLTGVNLDVINAYLEDELSGKYEVEDADFADLVGEYELSWTWAFDGVNDPADTTLGQIAANVVTAPASGYEPEEIFDFSITITQVN